MKRIVPFLVLVAFLLVTFGCESNLDRLIREDEAKFNKLMNEKGALLDELDSAKAALVQAEQTLKEVKQPFIDEQERFFDNWSELVNVESELVRWFNNNCQYPGTYLFQMGFQGFSDPNEEEIIKMKLYCFCKEEDWTYYKRQANYTRKLRGMVVDNILELRDKYEAEQKYRAAQKGYIRPAPNRL